VAYAFDYAAKSVVGLVRSSNQDSAYASPNLLVVADGMGGHAGGDVASTIAIEILKHLDHPGHTPATALSDLETALDHSQLALIRASDTAPQLQGLGTTVVCLMRTETTLVMAHMGDSRAYLLRNGTLSQVTVDHTFVQHLVDIGRITAEEAETHPQRNVVMRVLSDFDLDLHPDVSVREAKIGDRWLLCSDGLSGFMSVAEMTAILTGVKTPDDAAEALINRALANQSSDNVTCLVADIVDPATHFGTEPAINGGQTTVTLKRPIPRVQVVGAAADGGPLPDLVAAVVAGDDWDDYEDDAQPMSAQDFADHGLNYRELHDETPTNPVPIVTPASGTPAAVVAANPGAHFDPPLPTTPLSGEIPEVSSAQPATPLAGRIDPLYLPDAAQGRDITPRRRPWLTVTLTLLATALVALGLWRAYAWTQQQYFVGIYNNQVAVFRGIPQDLGPLNLHHPVLIYDTDTLRFPSLFVARLSDSVSADSFEDAVDRAERLIVDAHTQINAGAPAHQPATPGRNAPAGNNWPTGKNPPSYKSPIGNGPPAAGSPGAGG